jgi:hypothetical protein
MGLSVVEATSRFFFSTKRIFLVSFGSVIIAIAVLAVALLGAFRIIGMDDLEYNTIYWTPGVIGILCFFLFGALWMNSFIQELTQFVCMASFSTYYFSSTRHKEGSASVGTCLRLAFYHTGSIALACLLHPIVHILRILCPFKCI